MTEDDENLTDEQCEEEERKAKKKIDDGLKGSKAFRKAIETTLFEILDSAARDLSDDYEHPETPPETWQLLTVLLTSERVLDAMAEELRSRILVSAL